MEWLNTREGERLGTLGPAVDAAIADLVGRDAVARTWSGDHTLWQDDPVEVAKLLKELDIPQPENGIVRSIEEAHVIAERIGYPVLVRPSFVLGGRAMALVDSEPHLAGFIQKAIEAAPNQPILIDKFMEDAFEIDVDALADGERVVVGAIMQHIEEAGVHSGDAACVLPRIKSAPITLESCASN